MSGISCNSIEVILVVDEKYDGTYLELLGALSELDLKCKVVLVNEECNGPGNARNLGLSFATGAWIAFWDSDDSPKVVETLESIEASSESTQVIVCKYSKTLLTGEVGNPQLNYLNIALNPGLWRFIFRYELIKDCKFPDLKLGEDQVFLVTSGALSQELVLRQSVNYQYVMSGSNQLTSQNGNFEDLGRAVVLLRNYKVVGNFSNLANHFRKVMIVRLLITSMKRDWKTTFQNVANPFDAAILILVSIPSIIRLRFINAG
jgi:glycosyltransferase involved in cell wall biosynthesis